MPQQFVHYDYASGDGTTIRFGNGEFGEAPARGQLFRAVYRLGNGLNDNVAADSLTGFDATLLPDVISVTNSFDVLNALPPETLDNARHVAPEAFRVVRYNAVIEEDYADAVEELDWVQKAGAAFRWTGSWLTLFATPDPVDSYTISPAQSIDLEQQLDRYRLAGREAYGMDPIYANLVLDICVCVAPTSYIGDVEAAVMEALFGTSGDLPKLGFFSPDNWTFGMPLDRASLEAAIQAVPGVRAVEEIYIERRGWFETRLFSELVYTVAANEIVCVDNDPNFPERGALKLSMEGGA
jgi:predicted phage baseplate assembly protein